MSEKGCLIEIRALMSEIEDLLRKNNELWFSDIMIDIKRVNYLIDLLLVNYYYGQITKTMMSFIKDLRDMEKCESLEDIDCAISLMETWFEFTR